ncbi:MAG: hypothetical protein Q9227_000953 [Pyrenula ochraceoflavens]
MSEQNLPTILLLPGCFSTPSCFDRLVSYLHEAGYSTLYASYPSSNPADPSAVTAQKDIEHVRQTFLLPLVGKQRKDLIIAAHAFGGVVGAGAVVGLSKTVRRSRGELGGIVGLVYISGNIVQEGQTLIESAGGQWPPWLKNDKPSPGVAIAEPVLETLYNDCDPSLRPELEAAMTPHGYLCLDTKVSAPCWAEDGFSGTLAYVRTMQDQVNPVFIQDMCMANTQVHWEVESMDTSHGPFISQPGELAKHVVQFAEKFQAL